MTKELELKAEEIKSLGLDLQMVRDELSQEKTSNSDKDKDIQRVLDELNDAK
jgi:hypothetical protein